MVLLLGLFGACSQNESAGQANAGGSGGVAEPDGASGGSAGAQNADASDASDAAGAADAPCPSSQAVLVSDCAGLTPAAVLVGSGLDSGYFTPAQAEIHIGEAVEFQVSLGEHTATGLGCPAWDTGNIFPGESKCVTFSIAGTYPFHCVYHGGMDGVIDVTP